MWVELISSCVRSGECGAHNLLKLHWLCDSSKVKDTIVVRVTIVEMRLVLCVDQVLLELYLLKSLFIMAWSQAPYIHVILAEVVSIT